jgi:multiple sugar transport system permease protein
MLDAPTLRPGLALRAASLAVLLAWMVVAAFPLAWIVAMSFKLPVDAFSANPLHVLIGPATMADGSGLGVLDIVAGLAALVLLYRAIISGAPRLAAWLAGGGGLALGWVAAGLLVTLVSLLLLAFALPALLRAVDALLAPIPVLGLLVHPVLGATGQFYRDVWVGHAFWRNFVNSLIVTAGVVTLSLSVGTLAAFALARTRSIMAFALLVAALVFRALPPSVLVAGYLPAFITSPEWLAPLWHAPVLGALLHVFAATPPTLYGKPIAVIGALVAINQPFTIWMLRSFFANIPQELDEAAQVDGCTYFQAFRRVIMPVMWPGVVTTGLFSFLLAYNDYLVCAMLLDAQNQTMVPAISQYFNRETTTTDEIQAVAAAVSITAPLFLLVIGFQRQIVSGLTAGAVKG